MKYIKGLWSNDKLKLAVIFSWLMTVISSFWGSAILSITVPAIGEMFVFRAFLPITAILYLIWALRNKEPFLKGLSALEKWCYVFSAVFILYGVVSLPRAIEFSFTFRKLFNLCFDVVIFFLALRLFRDTKIRNLTLIVMGAMLIILMPFGVYESFFGGLVNPIYDTYYKTYIANPLYEVLKDSLPVNDYLQHPVVFSGNTNDYSSSILFVMSLLLLPMLRTTPSKKTAFAIILMGTVASFLFSASTARLVWIGFYVLLGSIILTCLLKQKPVFRLPILLICGVLCCNLFFEGPQLAKLTNELFVKVPVVEETQPQNMEVVTQPTKPDSQKPKPTKPDSQKPKPTNPTPQETMPTNPVPPETQPVETQPQEYEYFLEVGTSSSSRARLLIHSLNCFKESYGLGVGLGNTEILARDRQVTYNAVWSIHCFLARIIADYGIFILIPLAAIAWLLLKKIWQAAWLAIRNKDRNLFAYSLLCLGALLIFPIVSTSSSDAQDIIPMWLYLAGMVLYIQELPSRKEESVLVTS